MFNTSHLMFETQFNARWLPADILTERTRSQCVCARPLRAVQQLFDGHETAARTAREVFKVSDQADDQPTADLATQRMQEHEKTAWMLRSLLK